MSFDKLVYGQQNWNDTYNNNLSKTQEIQDTGWISLVTLAPATGQLRVRVVNNVMYFLGTITPNATGNVELADVPQIKNVNVVGTDANSTTVVAMPISKDSKLTILNATADNQSHLFAFDGQAVYVGPYNLDGVIDLLNHWFNAVSSHFNNRFESSSKRQRSR